ncbi:DUF2922 domain-containing protein [Liquorilactobacillus vini]|uniref:DUF2922 domain-containing protein n=1 Tax=Liquorilactobacillus vini DSM 20605 TaxID=1133569 RepID=A0A0R2CLW2_9LACO|nr:DUF2922 domain-containing protein [Liquorilactobacillus vini]KRM89545.1 hypothetical protein FD21_GL001403 [Liquorilactobacillus vini DSM 20605]
MKQLNLVFSDQTGKNKNTFRLTYANETLDQATVAKAMNDLAALNLFIDKDGQLMYVKPISAKYVETVETPIITEAE